MSAYKFIGMDLDHRATQERAIAHQEQRIKSFQRRLTVARSLDRRARHGRQINAARVRLAVLRLEAE